MFRDFDDIDGDDLVVLDAAVDEDQVQLLFGQPEDLAVPEDAVEVPPHPLVLLDDGQRVEEEHEETGQQVLGQVVVLSLFFLGEVSRDEGEAEDDEDDDG